MAKVEVSMPKMGESITEGTVIEWLKQPGDEIELDEPLLEIGTDKVDTEVPSPAAGRLAEIKIEAGETVDVGSVIAIIETDVEASVNGSAFGDDDGAAKASNSNDDSDADSSDAETKASAGQDSSTGPADEPSADAASVESGTADPNGNAADDDKSDGGGPDGESMDVLMPKMGESIMEGTVVSWAKQPGDEIDLDETLLEIATDKVDTEVPSPAKGIVQEILVEEGETVDVGTRIAVIGTSAGAKAKPSQPSGADKTDSDDAKKASDGASRSEEDRPAAKRESGQPAQAPKVAAGDGTTVPRKGPNGEFFSPLVRAIAEKEGISIEELATIPGSGRDSRVTKSDLLSWLDTRSTESAPKLAKSAQVDRPRPASEVSETREDGRVEVIKMDRMRQIIAEHMIRSKATSAHVTSFAEVDVTNLVLLRERNKEAFMNKEGIKLTYTPFFVYAAVEALRDHPILNASVEGNEILVRKDYHIGIAVAIGKTGLVAPVIRQAGQKNVSGLAHAAADLAQRARNKQLMPDQLQGGTFTVTNVGSLGSIMGTPIINQPQVGILATGAIKKRPVVIEDPRMGDSIAIRHMMFVSLSYDHRIVDGAMSASFLQRYTEVLESFDPEGEVK